MNKKTWIVIGSTVVIIVLAAAAYQATNLVGQGNLDGLNLPTPEHADRRQIPSGGMIPPTQLPARQPDLDVGLVVEIKDQSIFVRLYTKGSDSQDFTRTEIVTVGTTEIYHDVTNWDALTADDRLQRVLENIPLDQIKAGDLVDVWGPRRGERVIADVILVYAAPSLDTPER